MDCSVIIVSYNTRPLTMNCIQSVESGARNLRLEIWVVDNAFDGWIGRRGHKGLSRCEGRREPRQPWIRARREPGSTFRVGSNAFVAQS